MACGSRLLQSRIAHRPRADAVGIQTVGDVFDNDLRVVGAGAYGGAQGAFLAERASVGQGGLLFLEQLSPIARLYEVAEHVYALQREVRVDEDFLGNHDAAGDGADGVSDLVVFGQDEVAVQRGGYVLQQGAGGRADTDQGRAQADFGLQVRMGRLQAVAKEPAAHIAIFRMGRRRELLATEEGDGGIGDILRQTLPDLPAQLVWILELEAGEGFPGRARGGYVPQAGAPLDVQ